MTPTKLLFPCFFLIFSVNLCWSQKTCPNCGSVEVPYPLSTSSNCGDPAYTLHCDPHSKKLYFDALNGSSYLVLRIEASFRHMVIQPSPWLSEKCVTQDMVASEGLRLNQSLPYNVTSSNTIFLFNCSPRLFVSPLNCTPASLCHQYLERSGYVDSKRAVQCATSINPCCTFLAGGMPSAYKIRLHDSGCKAFRSIINLDPGKPANQWKEGLEIQWAPPREPVCKAQLDCSVFSRCSSDEVDGVFRCLCNRGYYWDSSLAICLRLEKNSKASFKLKVSIGAVLSFFTLASIFTALTVKRHRKLKDAKLAREREDVLKCTSDGNSARVFHFKEIKKATNDFSEDSFLGSGGFGEVYKGVLQDGTIVAVKSAKVGDIKSTQHVLNEVGILSQVNHKNLVRLLGVCMEDKQPLMIYEYISNGTLHDHIHGKYSSYLNWKTRLKIALQTGEALAYLHSSAHTPIYHRDVKSTNILLDEHLTAKVSDFGLSRLACPGLSHVSTCAQGTLGYLDPEYYRNYQLTDKSDVYSYGVVLLELLTSQKAVDFTRDQDCVNLAIYVSQQVRDGSIMEVVDKRLLLGDENLSDKLATTINLFVELGLACLREKKAERPCMTQVVQELQSIIKFLDEQKVN
ncbi:hypothetical protein ACFE04_000517 [Oxalis oulophora]